jgi:copper chaperone CopZ
LRHENVGAKRIDCQIKEGIKMDKTIKVGGMRCKSCAYHLKETISGIDGVSSVEADHGKGIVRVYMKDPLALLDVKKAIEDEGYTVLE